MRIARNIPSVVIIGFWLTMMGLLVQKEFLPAKILPREIRFPKELPYKENWGIYSKMGKAGYLKTEINLENTKYLWRNKAEISILPDNTISINSASVFDTGGKPERFEISLLYKDFLIDITGIIKENELKLSVKTPEGVIEYALPWDVESEIIGNGILPWFYISNLKIGDKFQWYLLNPLTQKRDLVKAVVRRASFYYNKLRPSVAGDFAPVVVVDIFYQDMKFEFWVDTKGDPLKVVTPWGWELEAE